MHIFNSTAIFQKFLDLHNQHSSHYDEATSGSSLEVAYVFVELYSFPYVLS